MFIARGISNDMKIGYAGTINQCMYQHLQDIEGIQSSVRWEWVLTDNMFNCYKQRRMSVRNPLIAIWELE